MPKNKEQLEPKRTHKNISEMQSCKRRTIVNDFAKRLQTRSVCMSLAMSLTSVALPLYYCQLACIGIVAERPHFGN